MTVRSRQQFFLAVVFAAVLPAAAHGQYYAVPSAQPAPAYPYGVAPSQLYAVRVSPNTYVIQRGLVTRNYPYVSSQPAEQRAVHSGTRKRIAQRPQQRRNDPALIDELKRQRTARQKSINTVHIVRHPPKVIETTRIVDDPPRIIEKRRYVEDAPARKSAQRKPATVKQREAKKAQKKHERPEEMKRVIRAEAEVTILGPDRMNIRLFRNRGEASVTADE